MFEFISRIELKAHRQKVFDIDDKISHINEKIQERVGNFGWLTESMVSLYHELTGNLNQ